MAADRDDAPWRKRHFSNLMTAENIATILAPTDVADELAAFSLKDKVEEKEDPIVHQLKRQRSQQERLNLFRRRQSKERIVVPYTTIKAQLSKGIVPELPPVAEPQVEPPVDQVPLSEFMPPDQFGVIMKRPCALLPHQVEAVKWAIQKESNRFHGILGGILSMEVGLGKTVTSLSIIMSQWKPGQCATLAIMPKTLMTNYLMDIGKFFGQSLKALIWDRSVIEDAFFLFTDKTPYKNQIVIVSYDTVLGLAKSLGTLSKAKGGNAKLKHVAEIFFAVPWFRVVCDESHRFANSKSMLWEALMKLKPGRRICLTGTAIRNYEADIYAQLTFCGFNALPDKRQWTIQSYQTLNLRDAIFVKSLEDAKLQLPPMIEQTHYVELSLFEKRVYNVLMNKSTKLMAAFKAKEAIFANVLEMFTRLRQVCIAPHLIAPQSKTKKLTDREKERCFDGSILGPEHVELERIVRLPAGPSGVESGKMLALLTIARAIPLDEKMIVFCEWAGAVQLAHKVLCTAFGSQSSVYVDGESEDRDADLSRFKLDPTARFLCSTNVANQGLTLVVANHCVLLAPSFSGISATQSAGRIHRIGQTRTCYVWQVIVRRSFEDRMLQILAEKHNIREILLEQGVNSSTIEHFLGEEFDVNEK